MNRISLVLLSLIFAFSSLAKMVETKSSIGFQRLDSFFYSSYQPENVSFEEISNWSVSKNGLKGPYSTNNLWVKIDLQNSENKKIEKILEIDSPLAGRVDYFELKNGKLELIDTESSDSPYVERDQKGLDLFFKIKFEPLEKKTIVLKRNGFHHLDAHLNLWNEKDFNKEQRSYEHALFIYMGAFISLFIFNFFLSFSTRDKLYLFYSLFLITVGTMVLDLQGFLDFLFESDSFSFSSHLMFFSSSSIFLALYFSYLFLEIYRQRKLKYAYWFLMTLSAIQVVINFTPLKFSIPHITGTSIDVIIGLGCLLMIFSGFYKWKNPLAKIFLLSWLFIFLGVLLRFMIYVDIIPITQLTRHGIMWGNLFEMVMISFALSWRIRVNDDKRRRAEILAGEKDKYQSLFRVLCHDIANSLFVVINSSKRALKVDAKEKQEKNITKVLRAAENISEILEQVRSTDSVRTKGIQVSLEKVNLLQVLDDAIFIFKEKLDRKNIELVYDDVELNREVMADRTLLLNHVISNLLSNSIKFSNHGTKITLKA